MEGGLSRIKPDIASRSREEPLGSGTAFTTGSTVGGFASRRAKGSTQSDDVTGEVQETERRERNISTPHLVGKGSPNESGTEADDESISYTKALPAPPLRPRKGLKTGMGTGLDGAETPLLTPSAIDEEGARFDFSVTSNAKSRKSAAEKTATDEELREARARFVKRRRAELGRRACEVLLLIVIGMLVLGNEMVRLAIQPWHRGQFIHSLCQYKEAW